MPGSNPKCVRPASPQRQWPRLRACRREVVNRSKARFLPQSSPEWSRSSAFGSTIQAGRPRPLRGAISKVQYRSRPVRRFSTPHTFSARPLLLMRNAPRPTGLVSPLKRLARRTLPGPSQPCPTGLPPLWMTTPGAGSVVLRSARGIACPLSRRLPARRPPPSGGRDRWFAAPSTSLRALRLPPSSRTDDMAIEPTDRATPPFISDRLQRESSSSISGSK